ncbi:hypothetical protein BJX99DRAFT_229814 [Aspergillus californicus]
MEDKTRDGLVRLRSPRTKDNAVVYVILREMDPGLKGLVARDIRNTFPFNSAATKSESFPMPMPRQEVH